MMIKESKESSPHSGEKRHGWAPDVGGGGSEAAQDARRRAMDKPPDTQGEGREISDAERFGVDSTETEPGSPYGVGESDSARPEETVPSKGTEGHKGAAKRPYGRTDDEDSGVGKEGAATEDSPNLPTGDQGG
jgi:hypothetical protein